MIDTHCHLTFPQYAGRVKDVLAAARAAGVRGAITIGTTSADSLAARDLALAHAEDNLWHSAGVHPLHSDEPVNWDDLRAAASSPRCVAWGELGLDNHYPEPAAKTQRDILAHELAFIEIAARANPGMFVKPIVIHCRDAFDDLIPILKRHVWQPGAMIPADRFVFHCFTGTVEDARKVLDFGAWISFTGVVTFANAPGVAEAAKIVPLDRMMVETDSPFLTPEPHRKVRPNEPRYVVEVAKRIAYLRGMGFEEFEKVMDGNAERFFGIRVGR